MKDLPDHTHEDMQRLGYRRATEDDAVLARDRDGDGWTKDGEVIELDAFRPHDVASHTCAHCGHWWVAVAPAPMPDALECSRCGKTDVDITTYLSGANDWLLQGGCCGEVDDSGACAAPACSRGWACTVMANAAAEIGRLRRALAEKE